MIEHPSNPAADIFGPEEDTISYGLLRSAVEMGEAVTEAGAVSAAAAFFRQNLDACAWAEARSPPFGTAAASPGKPPLLRFPLPSKGLKPAVGALRSSGSSSKSVTALPASSCGAAAGGVAEPRELVVSRGPGPTFSEHEVRVARYAALLLSQALARIRDCAALSEARSALEESFRGMQEASDAVAVLVEERERRSRFEAQQGADAEKRHKNEMSATESALEGARCEAERLRGQLDAAGESLAAVSEASGDVCRAVSAAVADRDAAERDVGRLSDEEARDDAITAIERAARSALRCSSARVTQWSSLADTEADPTATEADGADGASGVPGSAAPNGRSSDGEDGEEPLSFASRHSDEDMGAAVEQQLHVPVPYHDSFAGSLFLSVHGASSPRQRFTGRDRTVASALAACLGTALLAVRAEREKRRILSQIKADQREAATSAAEAEAEAQERGDRAVAGMRALIAAAELSRAQAEASASATRRAERHADALGLLLSGLDGGARSDHAAVARVVHRRAGAVVPGCAGAVLLTPRRDGRRTGASGSKGSLSFSPDPRAWATATAAAAAAAASREGQAAVRGAEKNGSGAKPPGRRWAKRVEKAVARAAATGKAACVAASGNDADGSGGGGPGVGDGGFRRGRVVVCFSPVLGVSTSERDRQVDTGASGRPFGSSASVCSDRMRTAELRGEEAASGGGVRTPCLIAWVLSLGEIEGVRVAGNNEEKSGAPWAAVSPLTDENLSSVPVVVEPPPPPSQPLLPPGVSAAMEAVVHAVDLALSACAAATPAAAYTARRQPGCGERGQHAEGAAAAAATAREEEEELEGSRRNEELRRLRDGTAALADRVRMLEGRAAGLRASEARSAAALARARADAGAVKGELELANLELERARRRKPLAARSVGNLSSPRRGGGSGGELPGAFRPFRAPSHRVVGSGSQHRGLAGISGRSRSGEDGGSGVHAAPVEGSEGARISSGVGGGGGGGGAKGQGENAVQLLPSPAAFASTAVLTASSLPLLPPPSLGDATSAALQHMASVHARLSSSLKSGRRLSWTTAAATTTPREGTEPVLLGVV